MIARMPEAVSITEQSAKAAGHAAAAGFLDNEIWEWILPNEERRGRLLRRHFPIIIRRVFLGHGTGWTSTDAKGACLWIPPEHPRRTAYQSLAEAISLVPWLLGGIRRAQRMEGLLLENHPTEPHWYLETLSIAPEAQRKGYGSALLEPGLQLCDEQHMPAYLETQREANVPYYRRFGWELTGTIKLDDSPPLWTMWREPR
jgi:GNAT superfamily N-acetyltransferase